MFPKEHVGLSLRECEQDKDAVSNSSKGSDDVAYTTSTKLEAVVAGPGQSTAGFAPPGSSRSGVAPADLNENVQPILMTMVSIQSLLVQFSHSKVRADFVNQCFGCNINPKLLPRIDNLRWLLLPRWQSGSLATTNVRSQAASYHWNHLIRQSDELFLTDTDAMEECLTYKEWFSTLEAVASDRYWTRVSPENRCTHILPSDDGSESGTASGASRLSVVMKNSNKDKKTSCDFAKMKDKHSLRKSLTKRKPKKVTTKTKVEEIIITSSDSSSDDNSAVSSPGGSQSSEDDSDVEIKRARPVTRSHPQRSSHSDNRAVVTPPMFQMNGKVSLKEYLATFERYFIRKFKGSSHDQTQMLSKFLSGDLLKVYEVRGGRMLKYTDMKKQLLEYYRKQKIGGKSYWREELAGATPGVDEGYEIFGMRLTELAELAYPNNKKECASHMRKQFFEALPSTICSKITDAERALRATTGGKQKYLPFSGIVQLAKDLQKESVKPKTVMWATQLSGGPEISKSEVSNHFSHQRPYNNNNGNNTTTNTREYWSHSKPSSFYTQDRNNNQKLFYNANHKQQPQQENQQVKYQSPEGSHTPKKAVACAYCKNPNHQVQDCWKASRSCLICGKKHLMEKCPKFDPQYRSRSGSSGPQRANPLN